METAMSTVESAPQTPQLVAAVAEIEPVAVLEPESEVRVATRPTLPVAASVAPALPAQPPAVRAPGATGALAVVRDAAGQLLPQLQYQITRLGIAGQAGLAAFVAAAALAVVALVPAHNGLLSMQAALLRAQHPLAAPGIEQAVPRLIASLPTRAQMPAVIGQMYAQAQAAGVALDKGRYAYEPPKSGAIGRYEVEFPVAAGYPAIRSFINGTLTAVPAAALDKLRLERKAIGDQNVNADIGFVVFVRGEGPP
jgi:hypothetical protein